MDNKHYFSVAMACEVGERGSVVAGLLNHWTNETNGKSNITDHLNRKWYRVVPSKISKMYPYMTWEDFCNEIDILKKKGYAETKTEKTKLYVRITESAEKILHHVSPTSVRYVDTVFRDV